MKRPPMIRCLAALTAAALTAAALAAVAAAEPFAPQPFQPTDLATQASGAKVEAYHIWPDVAPGEKENRPDGEKPQNDGIARIHDVTRPSVTIYRPKADAPKSDRCMIIFPGGGYRILAYDHEGIRVADYLTARGITCVVLKYRVPSRQDVQFYKVAFEDAQRTVSFVRARAKQWGFAPDKIGCMGFSAGGNLTMLVAANGTTRCYEPIDDVDAVPCNANFAVPVYPWRILTESASGDKGNDCMVDGKFKDNIFGDYLAFDAQTPPMCLVHGDADNITPMASAAIYWKLRTMDIPAELHIYAKVGHGFGMKPQDDHVGNWLERAYQWILKL